MKNKFILIYLLIIICISQSCKQDEASTDESATVETITPVTVTYPEHGNISDTVNVNAVSSFLLKTNVKASANGYLQTSNIQLGKFVSKGQVLFVLKTKEAEALGNTINSLDTSLHFHGTIAIRATSSGYISQLAAVAGGYVQDGEQLAEITDNNSFVFLLDLPYELKPYINANKILQLRLPDNTLLDGYIQSELPTLDSIAQTQRYIIKVKTNKLIPENLIAKVSITKTEKVNTTMLLKDALLSNEEQTAFWIMQLINDSTAVKVPVQKGLEAKEKVEIVSPPLSDSAKILLTGNYGLADTAKVKLIKE
ncbi:hypothetical protein BH11BAC6_BH11BAC6_10000 [soil metagenome]